MEGTWLGSRFTTLEHLVARKSDGEVVRTPAAHDLQRSPTVEDLDRITGHPLHKVFNVTAGWTYFDLKTVPEPEEHRPAAVPDPSRPIPRAVYITRPCWKGMVIPKDANDATPCNVARLWHRWSLCSLPQTLGGCFDTG